MALVECSKCAAKISTLLSKCPKCGAAQARTVDPRIAARTIPEYQSWAKMWALVSGWFLVAGFLIPIPVPQYGGTGALWSWDIVAHAPFQIAAAMVAPPVAGLALLLASSFAPRRSLPLVMTCLGGLAVVLELVLVLLLVISAVEVSDVGAAFPIVVTFLAVLGGFGIAAMNHVRKIRSHHEMPRILTGICGIVLVLFFLLPLGNRPQIVGFFEATWSELWPVKVGFLGCLAYGVAGIVSFKKFESPRKSCKVVSIMGKVALVLLPASFVVYGMVQSAGIFLTVEGQAPIALIVLKVFLSMYGLFLMPWAGIAALMISWLKPAAAAAPIPPALVEPVAPN